MLEHDRQRCLGVVGQPTGQELEQNDAETIRILGHNMKGCGSGYGFDGITDLGKSLEQAAKNGDKEEMKRKVSELSAYLDSLDIVYE